MNLMLVKMFAAGATLESPDNDYLDLDRAKAASMNLPFTMEIDSTQKTILSYGIDVDGTERIYRQYRGCWFYFDFKKVDSYYYYVFLDQHYPYIHQVKKAIDEHLGS